MQIIFWKCPSLELLWKEMFEAFRVIFKQNITLNPVVALLGSMPESMDRRENKYFLNTGILLIAALECVTFRWLKPEPSSYSIHTRYGVHITWNK